MPILHACRRCGRLSDQRYCPRHRGATRRGSWSPNRNRVAQARFRRAVLERDGHQCTYLERGIRCPVTTNLRACHRKPLRDFAPDDPAAYDPANGATLCADHDRLTDPHAR